jgi:formiminotetrahydrofolate cyclodeaminase
MHESLISTPLDRLLDLFASNEPYPAGGSASALAGAIGASLLMMAATIPKTRSGSAEEAAELAAAAVRLHTIRDTLLRLVASDSEAYANVIAALRATRATEEERAQRHEAIAQAMRRATEVPLETLRAARHGLALAVSVASNATRAAGSDINVAIELLTAAVRGASSSVSTNLEALKDREYVEEIAAERGMLEEEAAEDAGRARASL